METETHYQQEFYAEDAPFCAEELCSCFWDSSVDPRFVYLTYGLGLDEPAVVLPEPRDRITMPISAETSEQDVQTEEWTQENGVGTDEDWLLILRSVKEESDVLAAEWKSLEEKQAAAEVEHNARLKSLEKMREEKNRQYRTLLDKIDSMRDKLDLNNSKKMRKNFIANIEKLSAEKERHLEAKRRLAQDLEEAERKLKTLTEEQQNEKLSLEAEVAALQREKQTVSKLADEANQTALKDEMAAVESQKELAVSQVEDWIADAEKYLLALRSETSPQHNRQRLEWQKNVAVVRSSMTKLQESYNENLKLLLKGQQLDSLPTIPLPPLPAVPTMPLMNPVIRPAVPQPQFHPTHRVTGPPLPAAPLHNPVPFPPHVLDHNPLSPRLPMPAVVRVPIMPYVHGSQAPGYAPVSTATAHVGVPAGLPTAPTQNPTAQAQLPNPQPVGKLDKLLEKLGTQFPQCTRLQLTRVLQQIKIERGTMAGMSIDDIKQQVELKLAQHERPPPGPIAPPSGSRHFSGPPQRGQPMRPPVQAPGPHVFPSRIQQVTNTVAPAVRKLCLMCQNHVEPGTQYNTNCLHTLHKECISVWLHTSKNNSCPFCPSK